MADSVVAVKNIIKVKAKRKNKLSYHEKRELNELPAKIEKLEAEIAALHKRMSDPDFYKDSNAVIKANRQLQETESILEQAYNRWQELEALDQE